MAGFVGTQSKRDWVAWLALGVSALSLVATFYQARIASIQTSELRDQFTQSGPVLDVKSAVQFKFNDSRQAPPSVSDDAQPVVSVRDFDTYDSIYLVLTITNVGRLESSIIDANLQIAPGVTIDATGESGAATASCAVSGGALVDCQRALPYTLQPGRHYYIYFPLKDVWNKFRDRLVPTGALPGEVRASGTPPVHFKSGVHVQPS
jgi:hypothetical protein